MNLDGNPTSEMGYLLYDLASDDYFKIINSKEEFLELIENDQLATKFKTNYDIFMDKYACRGFKEIDIATKRIYEDKGMLYDKLKAINIEDNQLLKVKAKKEVAYERLLKLAKGNGFEKRFIKYANKYQTIFGYREHPKYVIVYLMAKLHDLVLDLGMDFVVARRLDKPEDIFSLHLYDISLAQQHPDYDVRDAISKNLKGYLKADTKYLLVIDSRGEIYEPKIEVKGD